MEFLLALQFLTRIPVTVNGNVEDKNMARSMAYFPLVGLLLGAMTAVVYKIASFVLPLPVCNLLAIAFPIMITGNMHVDGLMDTVDGIFSGRPRERILEIMKDSRVGSHGVMAGVLLVFFRFVLLDQIDPARIIPVLILTPALGRWTHVFGANFYPYARRSGGGIANFTDLVGRWELLWASLTAGIAALPVFGLNYPRLEGLVIGGLLIAIVVIATAGLARFIAGRIGGLTGDTYGAMGECIEVLALLVLQRFF